MNIDTYRDLFVHRGDVYAVQTPKGHYAPAGRGHFDRELGEYVYDEYFPLTDDAIAEHLAGFASYGVYVVDPELRTFDDNGLQAFRSNTVSYLVFDLDTYSPEAYEWLVHCLECFVAPLVAVPGQDGFITNYPCLLMENSGGKGFHAWLFLSEPTPAARVRSWVSVSFTPQWMERADSFDGTPLEIFPKQDEVSEGAFGNLVKLPLGVHAKSGKKSEFVPCQGWASGVDSVQRLDARLVPELTIRKDSGSASAGSERGGQGGSPAPFACISQIIEDGAPQGCRDKAMFHFAHYAHGTGMPEDLVEEWCERVNEGFSPPLRLSEVRTKVRSANAMNAPHPGCNADWLKGFCPGGERCFAPWNEDKPARAGGVEVAESYLDMSPDERRAARLRRE